MNNNEFTWLGALTVFWALTWRTAVFGIPLAIIAGVIVGVVGYFNGASPDTVGTYSGIFAQIAILPIYIYVIKRLFNKGFGKYRLQVVEKE